jgi:hypothetical protein
VSCSCCTEPFCCMYPAFQLNITYTADDLPEGFVYIFTYPLGISPIELGGVHTIHATRTTGVNYVGLSDTGLVEIRNFRIEGGAFRWDTVYLRPPPQSAMLFEREQLTCLLNSGQSLGARSVYFDKFKDCYRITWIDNGERTANVTRRGPCVWRGVDNQSNSARLTYNTTNQKWEVVASLGTEAKDSNQSAPDAGAGTYGDYTVTEC